MSRNHPTRRTALAALTAFAAMAVSPAFAQGAAGFPARPIKIVVPYAAGGFTDIMARMQEVYNEFNRNKYDIALDPRTEAGKKILFDLALASDIVIDNFRPHVVERMGLPWDRLHAENPRVSMISMPAYWMNAMVAMMSWTFARTAARLRRQSKRHAR